MVVRTPSLVYIYLSIVSRNTMNENKVFLLSLSLSLNNFYSSFWASPFSTFEGTPLDILQHDWNMVCRSKRVSF